MVDDKLLRLAEVNILQGDASTARRVLGRQPEVGSEALVHEMVKADMECSGIGAEM